MLTIDLESTVPLTEQIVRGLRCAIAERRLAVGDDLPTVRQLAGDLGVNFNTVARAYRALEVSGLVRSLRGRGSWIVAVNESDPARAALTARSAVRTALADARLSGLLRGEVEELVSSELEALWRRDGVAQEGL